MKKTIFATLVIALISVGAQAASKAGKLFIPALIESSFYQNFPGVSTPQWSLDNQYMKATFVDNNVSTNAYFSMEGELEGTVKAATFDQLPAKAQEHIKTKYPDYKVGEVVYFIDNNQEDESDIFTIPDSEANYFVSLVKDGKQLVLQVNKDGDTAYYTEKNL